MSCPACGAELPRDARFCSRCGLTIGREGDGHPSSPDAPTELAPPGPVGGGGPAESGDQPTELAPEGPTPAPASRPPGSAAATADGGRFLPGAVLAGRYRIVAVLGRGGMGEVYRADDLKLGQQVALKFLPEAVARDPQWLERFLNEVKIARQISNPNVCRVYDVAEVDGHHFLSMEYIDGEDLASLLRRIGRLPGDKAVQIGRQICAGLAAAHEQRVLHRDLKPANVMIDGRGNARLTDFGLAGLADELGREDAVSGTPAYMAPEQLAGREVTVKSDIYSLGLLLYELFTGKRAYEAKNMAELSRLQLESTPTSPSTLVEGLDPAVERVILRCLEKEPRERPESALAVSAALPGGDPLAAALAAGETPSPEMVAAAGEDGSLARGPAVALLAALAAATLLYVGLADRVQLPSRVPHELPREVLAHRAQEMLRSFGAAPDDAVGRAQGFSHDFDVIRWLESDAVDRDDLPRLVASARPAILRYWHRHSPRELLPLRNVPKVVSWGDPPSESSGMVAIRLDTAGRLVDYQRVPPQLPPARDAEAPEPDWGLLFTAAGLELESFRPSHSTWVPPVYADRRAAWTGSVPELPDVELRVEAAAFEGSPVYFRLIGPWSRAERQAEVERSSSARVARIVTSAIFIAVLFAAAWAARRNLLGGRGDRRGALRLAVTVLTVNIAVWVLAGHHARDLSSEFGLFVTSLGFFLFQCLAVWLLYMALEPYVRRHRPHWLVAWGRLVAGRLRDPLVARDILVGAALGGLLTAASVLHSWLELTLGSSPALPDQTYLEPLEGLRQAVGRLLYDLPGAAFAAMLLLYLWVLLRRLLRSDWLTGAVLVAILLLPSLDLADLDWVALAGGLLVVTLLVLALVRFGLLTMIATLVFAVGISNLPLSLEAGAWWSQSSWICLALLAALAVWAFRSALRGRPQAAG